MALGHHCGACFTPTCRGSGLRRGPSPPPRPYCQRATTPFAKPRPTRDSVHNLRRRPIGQGPPSHLVPTPLRVNRDQRPAHLPLRRARLGLLITLGLRITSRQKRQQGKRSTRLACQPEHPLHPPRRQETTLRTRLVRLASLRARRAGGGQGGEVRRDHVQRGHPPQMLRQYRRTNSEPGPVRLGPLGGNRRGGHPKPNPRCRSRSTHSPPRQLVRGAGRSRSNRPQHQITRFVWKLAVG